MVQHPCACAALAITSVALLSGCAGIIGAQAGAAGLATPRGHTPVVASANAHEHVGVASTGGHSAVIFGPELNLRATRDYGHGDVGVSVGGMMTSETWAWLGYLRFTGTPLGLSSRSAQLFYAPCGGVELGAGYAVDRGHDVGPYVANGGGAAITLSLRGDLEGRPAQASGQPDAFVGLMVGVAFFATVSNAR